MDRSELNQLIYAGRTVPAARPALALMALAPALMGAGLVTMFAASFDPGLSARPFSWLRGVTLLFLLGACCFAGGRLARRALAKKVQRARGRLCPHCLYSREGLEPPYTCAECGRTYSPEECEWVWTRAGLFRPGSK